MIKKPFTTLVVIFFFTVFISCSKKSGVQSTDVPLANFYIDSSNNFVFAAPCTIKCIAKSINTSQHVWIFNDKDTIYGDTVLYDCDDIGFYKIKCIATSKAGLKNSVEKYIDINHKKTPLFISRFSLQVAGTENYSHTVIFNQVIGSPTAYLNQNLDYYLWDFGDGTILKRVNHFYDAPGNILNNNNDWPGDVPNHYYAYGTYKVVLKAVDRQGAYSRYYIKFTINSNGITILEHTPW